MISLYAFFTDRRRYMMSTFLCMYVHFNVFLEHILEEVVYGPHRVSCSVYLKQLCDIKH